MKVSVPYDTMSTTSRSEMLFTKCCCCFSLRTGCFILGYLNMICNAINTLTLFTLVAYVGIVTHGFDHFDPEETEQEKTLLTEVGVLLMVVLCANAAWLLINIACLVGLHRKRPGPIRIYVGFATARLLLSLVSFLYLVMSSKAGSQWSSTESIVSHSLDLCLAAYFILVYYVYAIQLEKEQAAIVEMPLPPTTNDGAFILPTKLDKKALVA